MAEVYVAVQLEMIIATFSTLDKAKAAVEAKIRQKITTGGYGHQYARQNPIPALTWRDNGGGNHECGFVRLPYGYDSKWGVCDPKWLGCDPEIYTIELDPEET